VGHSDNLIIGCVRDEAAGELFGSSSLFVNILGCQVRLLLSIEEMMSTKLKSPSEARAVVRVWQTTRHQFLSMPSMFVLPSHVVMILASTFLCKGPHYSVFLKMFKFVVFGNPIQTNTRSSVMEHESP
jgi:hypothetical protein